MCQTQYLRERGKTAKAKTMTTIYNLSLYLQVPLIKIMNTINFIPSFKICNRKGKTIINATTISTHQSSNSLRLLEIHSKVGAKEKGRLDQRIDVKKLTN